MQSQEKNKLTAKGEKIRKDCLNQNAKFCSWAKATKWQVFHSSHYDWWAFPIDMPSGSYGTAYKVEIGDLSLLRSDPVFIKAVRENAIMVCQSWGWNLEKGCEIKNTDADQKWQRWPIRLSKMCRSLEIFKEGSNSDLELLFQNAIKYGMEILNKYQKLTYGGKDLSPYFRQKNLQIQQSKKSSKLQNILMEKSMEKIEKNGDQNIQIPKKALKQEEQKIEEPDKLIFDQ